MTSGAADTRAIDFEAAVTLTGDLTLEELDKSGFRVWLGQSIGSVSGGVYKDTSIIATGKALGLYVRRNGKSVGTILIDLGPLVAQAIDIFEDKESDSRYLLDDEPDPNLEGQPEFNGSFG